MSIKTNEFRTLFRNFLFNGGSLNAPTEWWLQVYSQNPGSDLSVAPVLPTRFRINSWQMEGSNAASNNSPVTITNTTGSTITIAYASIHTHQTGGTALFYGPFRLQFILAPSETFTIQPGRLKITIT